jgi:hypothetical protein
MITFKVVEIIHFLKKTYGPGASTDGLVKNNGGAQLLLNLTSTLNVRGPDDLSS